MATDPMTQPATDRRGFVRAAVVGAGAFARGTPSMTRSAAAGGRPIGTTPRAAHIALARAFYTPFTTGQVALYDTVLAPDWVDHPLGPGQAAGRDGFKPTVQAYRAALHDLAVTIDDVVADGDKVAIRTTFRGTHAGAFLGVTPTGRRVAFRATDIHHIVGDLTVESWHLEDLFGLARQLTAPR